MSRETSARPRYPSKLRALALLLVAAGLPGLLLVAPAAAYEAGDEVKPFTARDAQGRTRRSADYEGKKHLVLVVWGSRCPHSRAYGDRLRALHKAFRQRGVAFLGLAPSRGETPESIQQGKKRGRIDFPVLLDPEGKIARDLGAVTTPTVYLIDREGKLRYQGAIDDDPKGRQDDPEAYLREAIEAVLAGKEPPRAKVRGSGFRIRY